MRSPREESRLERVNLYDENFSPLGTGTRSEAHHSGAWHQAAHLWIISPERKSVLFQLRCPTHLYFPSKLDVTAAGGCEAGEKIVDTVLRETAEELHIHVKPEDLTFLGIKIDVGKYADIINREFSSVFFLRRDQPVREYQPESVEVTGLFEIPIEEGLSLFGRETRAINIRGILWNPENMGWEKHEIEAKMEDFVPRIDPYYLRVFSLARQCIKGEKYLAI